MKKNNLYCFPSTPPHLVETRIQREPQPNGRLNSLEHHTGLSASEDFNKVKAASGLHLLQLPIPCKRFAIDDFKATTSTAARNMLAPRWAHMSTYLQPCGGCSPGGTLNRMQERATQPRTEEGWPLD
jgi:hypothetical protein